MSNFYVTWPIPMYVIEQGWKKGRERFIIELEFNLASAARRIEGYAKANHPWRNRTGDAEREFSVEIVDGHKKMTMGHGVPYGKFLEAMQGGRFGVIPMTLTYGKPVVQEALQKALDQSYGAL